MAYPQVLSVAHSNTPTDQTSHTVTLPSGIGSGDLLLAFAGLNGAHAAEPVFPAGWTRVCHSNAFNISAAWAYRVADGTEGASITCTSTSEQAAFSVYRIEGHGSTAQAPQSVAYYNAASTGTATGNPDNLTPTGGSKEYLWFFQCVSDSGVLLSAAPTDFGNLLTSASGSTANASVAVGTARREYTAASYNVVAGTLASSESSLAVTVVVHPGAEGGGGGAAAALDPFGMSGFFGA